jgi:hypothetical protein
VYQEEEKQKIEEEDDYDRILYPEYDADLNRDMRIRIRELEVKADNIDYALKNFFNRQKMQAMFDKYNPFNQKYKGKSWKEYFESIKKRKSK